MREARRGQIPGTRAHGAAACTHCTGCGGRKKEKVTSKHLVSATKGMELLFNKRGKTRDAEDLGEKAKSDFRYLKFEVLFSHLRRLPIEA